MNCYRQQKPSRSTQITISRRGIDEAPKATSSIRGFVRITKRRARLLAKVYEIDPLMYPKCRSKMKIIAVIKESEKIRRILAHPRLMTEQHAILATRLVKIGRAPAFVFAKQIRVLLY